MKKKTLTVTFSKNENNKAFVSKVNELRMKCSEEREMSKWKLLAGESHGCRNTVVETFHQRIK